MNKLEILAVDDEEGILKIIKEVFHNHNLTTETSSLKATELIQRVWPPINVLSSR